MKKNIVFIVTFLILVPSLFAQENWRKHVSEDEMTGAKSIYLFSTEQKSTKQMDFPYGDVTCEVAIGMDEDSEWVYLYFSKSPNLVDGETSDGYNTITTRVKYGEIVHETSFTQDWGAKFLHFSQGTEAIQRISSSNEILIELNWYGSGKVYFKIPTAGLSPYLASARAELQSFF